MNLNLTNKKYDLFHPFIIVIMVILFLLIAMPMWYFYGKLPSPDFSLYLYIGIGLLSFLLGIFLANHILKNKDFNYNPILDSNSSSVSNSALDSSLKLVSNSALDSSLKLVSNNCPDSNPNSNEKSDMKSISLSDSFSRRELLIMGFVVIGILLQIINIVLLGGIPLFSASLKAKAATKIWLLSYIIFLPSINILLAGYNRKSHYMLLIAGLLLFVMTGYRTTPIAIMLSALITLYYSRDVDLKYIALAIALIAVVLLAVGFIAVQAISWQHWSLNPIELLSYRAAFTLNILSSAIQNQFSTMGSLFYATLTGFFTHIDPRVLVGIATISRNHSITSTIFGPALLDFGIIGMILQMFFLGIILKTLYHMQYNLKGISTAFYGILLAQTVIWIETGPTDVVVWLFYFAAILLIIKYLRGLSHEN